MLDNLRRLVSSVRPVELSVYARSDRPVLVLSDAAEVRLRQGTLHVGVVVWDPESGRMHYTSVEVPKQVLLYFAWLAAKGKYICQLELLAVAVAYETFPDLLRGRLVHHFVDNQAAMSNMISGYSGKPDSAVILGAAQRAILALACYPWFSFVCSGDNLSDLPSRKDFALLKRLGAIFRVSKMPDFSDRPGWCLV